MSLLLPTSRCLSSRLGLMRCTPSGRHRGLRRAHTTTVTGRPPKQHVLTLRELDRLVTAIAKHASPTSHPSPLAMRSLPVPWLSLSSPDLTTPDPSSSASTSSSAAQNLTIDEMAELDRGKHMSESFTSFDLPLQSDKKLFERYVNASGGFRMGKLLEHLDSLAGAVAYRHCLPTPPSDPPATDSATAFHAASTRAGLYLATASADRLDMFGRLNRDNVRDLRFSGFVTWTGSSSLEVVVKMEAAVPVTEAEPDGWETMMLGRFAMVCRDAKTHKARKVPPLVVDTEEERILWQVGEEHKQRRKESAMMALDKVPPSSEEAKELHDLMLQVTDKGLQDIDGEQVVLMKDTELESVQLMFPQDRNLHGKVFGGILMRLAFELAFTNAAIFASHPLRFLSLDQITFRLPVPIGAVLRLHSTVVKTTRPHEGVDGEAKVHIMVRAEVEEVDTGIRRETNTFFFTMASSEDRPIGRTVVPQTYAEAMHYLEGQRRLQIGDEMRRLYRAAEPASS